MSDLPPPPSPSPSEPTPSSVPNPPTYGAPEPQATPPVDPLLGATQVPSGPTPLPADESEKTQGMIMHLLPLAGIVLTVTHIPFLNILAPLVFWLMKKDQSAYLNAVGKEVLNFQITVGLIGLACIPLIFVCVGVFMLFALGIAAVVFIVLAAIAANKGEFYRYPYTLRLIK